MTEKGRIQTLTRDQVTIQLEQTESCVSCGNTGCKKRRGSVQAYNPKGLSLAAGDLVELHVESRAQLRAAFWVFGFPLIIFMGAYALGRLAFPRPGEGVAVLSGLGGLILGMLIGMLMQKGRRLDNLPVITRRLEGPKGSGDVISE